MSGPAKAPGTPSGRPDPGRRGDDPEDGEADLPVLRNLKEQDQTRNRVIGIAAGIAGWQLARLVPGLGIMFVVLAVPFAIGAAVGRYLLRTRPTVRAVASWCGLIAWFFPVFGMLVAGATFVGQEPARPANRERILAGVALLLSIGNAVVGVLMKRG